MGKDFEKEVEVKVAEALGWLSLIGFHIASAFYKVLLSMLVWNWFIADYSFTIGYWQMFLVLVIFSFLFGGKFSKLEIAAKINKISGKRTKVQLGLDESYKVAFKALLTNTFIFVILYGIYLLI